MNVIMTKQLSSIIEKDNMLFNKALKNKTFVQNLLFVVLKLQCNMFRVNLLKYSVYLRETDFLHLVKIICKSSKS